MQSNYYYNTTYSTFDFNNVHQYPRTEPQLVPMGPVFQSPLSALDIVLASFAPAPPEPYMQGSNLSGLDTELLSEGAESFGILPDLPGVVYNSPRSTGWGAGHASQDYYPGSSGNQAIDVFGSVAQSQSNVFGSSTSPAPLTTVDPRLLTRHTAAFESDSSSPSPGSSATPTPPPPSSSTVNPSPSPHSEKQKCYYDKNENVCYVRDRIRGTKNLVEYHCLICPAHKTKNRGDIQRHMESLAHSERKYTCPEPGCKVKTTRRDSLVRHMKSQGHLPADFNRPKNSKRRRA